MAQVEQGLRNGLPVTACNIGITTPFQKLGSHQQKSANSANIPPRLTNREDNAELNTGNREMCREHTPTPKGMTCSELRSNAKRAAEMTAPAARRVTKLQDAKVAHIQWYGTSGVNNRRKHGVLSDIDTTLTS